MKVLTIRSLALLALFLLWGSVQAQEAQAEPESGGAKKPNILVIWGDDVGMWNIGACHNGMMGGRTPNIDRIANEGAIFTDAYAQQSCTASRASFLFSASILSAPVC